MTDAEHRLQQIENRCITHQSTISSLESIVKIIDPPALIAFKATAAKAIETTASDLGKLEEIVQQIRTEQAVQKTKMFFYGVIGGFVATVLGNLMVQLVIHWLRNKTGTP